MDELLLKNNMVNNIEISVNMEEHRYLHEDFLKLKDPECEREIEDIQKNIRYRKFWNDRSNSGLMTEIAPGIPYTNEMADNGKLNYKQKRERDNIKKSLKQEYLKDKSKDEIDQISDEEWARVNAKNDFLAGGRVLINERNKRRNKKLQQIMKLNKVTDASQLSEADIKLFSIGQRFWMDDVDKDVNGAIYEGKKNKIKEFVEAYVFDRNIIEHFNRAYIKENFSKALKELNEIKGVAEYLQMYPDTVMKQNMPVDKVVELARQCDMLFNCEMKAIGFEYSEEPLTQKAQLNETTIVNDNYVKENCEKQIKLIIADTNKELDRDTLEKELNKKYAWTRSNEYEQYVSEEHRTKTDELNGDFRRDYGQRAILCAYYNAQMEYLNEEILKLGNSHKDNARRNVIDDKINTITIKLNKVMHEMRVVYSAFTKLHENKKLSFQEQNYVLRMMSNRDKQKCLLDYVNVYFEVNAEEKVTVTLKEEEQKKLLEEAGNLCKSIQTNMGVSELINMQKQLYEMQKMLKRVDKTKLSTVDSYNIKKIEVFATRARASVIYYANQHLRDNLNSVFSPISEYKKLTKAEQDAIKEEYGEINFDTIDKYAMKQINISIADSDSLMSEFLNSSELHTILEKQYQRTYKTGNELENPIEGIRTKHPEVVKRYMEMPKKLSDLLAIYQSNKEKLAGGSLTEEERKEAEREMKYAEIVRKLHIEKYYISGNSKKKLNGRTIYRDTLIRGISGIERIPEFSDMTEEEMFNMMSKLSVGVFEETKDVDKTEYRRQNLEGLAIFKSKLLEHYKKMYSKYGLRWMDMDQYVMNMREVNNDFAESQPQDALRYDPDNFDMNNSEDRLLYALIGFYRPMIATLSTNVVAVSNGKYVAKYANNTVHNQWVAQNVQKHFAYLKEHEGELK